MAPLAKYNDRTRNVMKGEPRRFINGHQNRGRKQSPERIRKFSELMKGHPVSPETREKISRTHKTRGIQPSPEATAKSNMNRPIRENHHSWKGGVSMMSNGYRCVYFPDHPRAHANGYVYEHVKVAEEKLGRPLSPGEVVHHLDFNKLNNSPDNLFVLPSQSAHARLHNRMR